MVDSGLCGIEVFVDHQTELRSFTGRVLFFFHFFKECVREKCDMFMLTQSSSLGDFRQKNPPESLGFSVADQWDSRRRFSRHEDGEDQKQNDFVEFQYQKYLSKIKVSSHIMIFL